MQAIKRESPGSDEELAARAAAGEQGAFAALYERHFDEVYDLAARTARDPELGPDVVQSTFATAWDRLSKRRTTSDIGAWLFRIARMKAIEGLCKRKPVPAGSGARDSGTPPFTRLDATITASEPAALAEFDQEIVETVWSCASALRPKQYSLLDLHLRRGLSADELAESLGLSRQSVYTMLSRLRLGLLDSVTGTLLARRGRRQCRSLDGLLSAIEITHYTREVRQIIHDHLKECEVCRAFRRSLSSPLEVFSALALVPAPPGLKAVAWRGISSHMSGLVLPVARGRLPRPLDAVPTRTTLPLVAAGVAALIGIIAVLVAGVLVFGSSGGGGVVTVADPDDVRATDRVIGEPSTDNTIEIGWTAVPGAQAFSVDWTEDEDDLPDADADLEGTATSATSPSLEPGIWYFHLRTQGADGNWTSTVHLGPFEIIDDARPSASPTTPPSPTPSGTPPPAPQFPTEAAPPPTKTPPPAPEPTATPTLTPTPAPPTPTAPLTVTPSPSPTNGGRGNGEGN